MSCCLCDLGQLDYHASRPVVLEVFFATFFVSGSHGLLLPERGELTGGEGQVDDMEQGVFHNWGYGFDGFSVDLITRQSFACFDTGDQLV